MDLQNQIRLPRDKQSLWFKVIMRPWSYLYLGMLTLRKLFYGLGVFRSRRLPGFCISVGNLTLGGTGKTPVVIELARYFSGRCMKVVILTRGYRSGLKPSEYVLFRDTKVIHANFEPKKINADEAILQSYSLPEVFVLVGSKRFEAATEVLSLGLIDPDIWILDDGFQHLRIQRDLDLLLVDESAPFGNRMLLPAGDLREPEAEIERATVVLKTRASKLNDRSSLWEQLISEHPQLPIFPVFFEAGDLSKPDFCQHPDSDILSAGSTICVVLGIARPEAFISSLENRHLVIRDCYIVGDHKSFCPDKLTEKITQCDAVVTSGKDYWRDTEIFLKLPIPTYVLDLKIKLPIKELEQQFEKSSIVKI